MEKTYEHKQEEQIYLRWERADAFSAKKTGRPYTILMPPPNANGSLHAGHGMYTIEDILIRFKRMQGFSTLWIPGMDHAGIETQYVYEKYLAKQGKSRMDFDRVTLYNDIRKFVNENTGVIYQQFKRLGFSADWGRSLYSLDQKVLDQVFDSFDKMAKDGLIYRSNYMVNYCTHCGTSLAELEVKHIEREDPLYYLRYGPLVIATVRPETRFGDCAVAVNPSDKRYSKWVGTEIEVEGLNKNLRLKVIADDYVDMTFGTGVVKITPAHDMNDFELGQRHNLEIRQAIDLRGKLTELAGQYAGLGVVAARKKVVEDMAKKGLIEKIDEHYNHNVTVCYKCGRDLEPMVVPNWFVKVGPLKSKVIEAVKDKKTRFVPRRFERYFLNWMEIMHDWPISRQIAWGIRVPAWYSVKKNPEMIVGFLDRNRTAKRGRIIDLLAEHSLSEIDAGLQTLSVPVSGEYVISKTRPEGEYLQETDTFDTWFSSGQWPLMTLKEKEYATRFPTDVLGTLSEILKFWVSRMMMFSLYWRDQVPFKVVYLWTMVVDAKGIKMSKSKGNVVNPLDLIDKFGADALRMSLIYGTSQGGKVFLAEDKVRGMRNFANKIWNAARFVKDFEGIAQTDITMQILYTKTIPDKMTKLLDGYRLGSAAEFIYDTFWHDFCDLRIEEAKGGKIGKQQLREALILLLKLLHPFMPFVTEAVWGELHLSEKLLIEESWPGVRLSGEEE